MRHSTNPPAPAQRQADLSPVQALGNQLMQSVQPKLEVNAPNDSYEQEADRFADQVTSAPAQRASKEPEKKKDDQAAQKKPLAAQATPLIQRAGKADEKKKDDKTAQKAGKAPDEKKKDDKTAQKMPVQRAGKADEKKKDDKTAQRAGKAPDEKKDDKAAQKMPVQRATTAPTSDDEEMAQAKRAHPAQLDDEKEKKKDDQAAQKMPVQREAADTTAAPLDVEQDVERQKHGGRPLTGTERQYYEPVFGADFSRVRVHDDAEAARAADSLNAKAFTQGSHIFFGSGYHQPNDTPGRQLMAHELTHTLQQGGAQPAAPTRSAPGAHASAGPVQRQTDAPVENAPAGLIQREPTAPAPGGGGGPTGSSSADSAPASDPATDATQFDKSKGQIDTADPPTTITFDKIKIPSFKNAAHRKTLYSSWGKLRRTKNYKRGSPDQRDKWRSDLSQSVREVVDKKKEKNADPKASNFVFEVQVGSKKYHYFGSLDDIARELTIPPWGGRTSPQYRQMQVDHIVELQLADWPQKTDANDPKKNMELLNGPQNASSGSSIDANINAKLDKFVKDTKGRYGQSARELREKFNIDFEKVDPASGSANTSTTNYWTRDDISQGKHLGKLRPSNLSSLGGSGSVLVFGGTAGGRPQDFKWPGSLRSEERHWLKPFEITNKTFNTDAENVENDPKLGELSVTVPPSNRNWKVEGGPDPIDVARVPGSRYAGTINKAAVKNNLYKLSVKKSSPIQITSFDIGDSGIEAQGVITSDLPIIRGATIDFELAGGELTLSKTFSPTEFTLPPPIKVTNSELTFAISTGTGLSASGRMDFEISNLGNGYLAAGAGTATSIFLEGHFDFDSKLFQPASITMRYKDSQFSGEGKIGIPSGKLKGIRSAQIDVSYGAGTFTASGTVEPSLPGVQQGTLGVVYSEQDGLVISGSLQLAENPAIRSGSIEARVQRKPDGSYKVHASGTAQPKIPGLDSALSVTYDDGALDMDVTASFSRGMLKGSLHAAATNRAVNPETGQPAGEPTEKITVYGGGSVTVQFAPWLQGTAGINLLPNGEIEISGSIGLPNTVNLFDAKRFDRNIFHVNIDIPIVGVSVAGQRIGIFATIGGGLDLRAGIGPGQLQNLNLGVTYNPSHEDQTHVTGHGEFVIPADAGLRLSIHGGIGAGIPIVSAEAGIEVSGELGLQGEARAAVDVDWTPQRGIVLDAQGSIFVEPRLKLDVSAYVSVTADLLLTTIDLYSKRWRLAGTEIGSNLRFGVTFPIHYEQGKPFSLSTDDVHFVIPEIDPQSVLSGILG
jgi:hypothetical protein